MAAPAAPHLPPRRRRLRRLRRRPVLRLLRLLGRHRSRDDCRRLDGRRGLGATRRPSPRAIHAQRTALVHHHEPAFVPKPLGEGGGEGGGGALCLLERRRLLAAAAAAAAARRVGCRECEVRVLCRADRDQAQQGVCHLRLEIEQCGQHLIREEEHLGRHVGRDVVRPAPLALLPAPPQQRLLPHHVARAEARAAVVGTHAAGRGAFEHGLVGRHLVRGRGRVGIGGESQGQG